MAREVKLVMAGLVVLALLMPTIRWLYLQRPDGQLYGYVDDVPPRPDDLWISLLDRRAQKWAERAFDVNVGFRAALIRSFNEVNFRLFRETPRTRLYATPEHGLYSHLSIDSLNDEILHRRQLSAQYDADAERLLAVQKALHGMGKHFVVLIASSKAYVYPDGLDRYLAGGGDRAFDRAARLGLALEKRGVNVVDAGPLLRDFASRTGSETHPHTGLHWSYYGGCLAAERVFAGIRRHFGHGPELACGDPLQREASGIDTDGLELLNIWSDAGLKRSTLTHRARCTSQCSIPLSILIVGDSFADQVREPIAAAGATIKTVFSNYLRTREIDGAAMRMQMTHTTADAEASVRAAVAEDIAASDVVVLQMVDYNVPRRGYGLPELVLSMGPSSVSRRLSIFTASGGFPREGDDKDWWHWVERKIVFSTRPIAVPRSEMTTRLVFEYGTNGRQTLTVSARSRDGTVRKFSVAGNDGGRHAVERILDVRPADLVGIEIEADGKPSRISPNDPRMTTFIVRNISASPAGSEREVPGATPATQAKSPTPHLLIDSATGSHGKEGDDRQWWHWVERRIVFAMRPIAISRSDTSTRLVFEYGTTGQQSLTISARSRDDTVRKFSVGGNDGGRDTVERILDVRPADLVGIEIEADGKPSRIGPNDPRMATFIVRNVVATPIRAGAER